MKRWMKSFKRRFRRDQAGQSIVFLAIAFIALVAFVGLVTDVAILFVRYSQLRRTVDAAAIAAAAQLREGKDYGDVSVTARQFILLHGIEPLTVDVETCETDIIKWRTGARLDEHPGLEGIVHPEYDDQGTPDVSDDTGYRIADMPSTELCNWQAPRKLVRVSAQVDSPTFFLQILGFDSIRIEATSVSETAVLDIVLLMDTSQSMAKSTTYEDYADVLGTGVTIRDASNDPFGFECNLLQDPHYVALYEQVQLTGEGSLTGQDALDYNKYESLMTFSGCCNNPGSNAKVDYDETTESWFIYTDDNGNNDYDVTDRLGIWDTTFDGNAGSTCDPINDADCMQYYIPQPGNPDAFATKCNAPDQYPECIACNPSTHSFCYNPVGDRSDLVCQPFRQAKDAARNFVQSLDYVRGDRIAFAYFDRKGYIAVPTNKNADSREYMISDERLAIETLNQKIGVREDEYTRRVGNTFGCENDLRARIDFDYGGSPTNDNNAIFTGKFGDRANVAAVAPGTGDNPLNLRRWSYESIAPCPDTNVGGGLLAANNALVNAETIRRDAVWVIILLGDGAATATDNILGVNQPAYGSYGMCPWNTFCNPTLDVGEPAIYPAWPECPAGTPFSPPTAPPLFCNDGDPQTRNLCLAWNLDDPEERFAADPALYNTCVNEYDADDYARDMADFAGLIQVTDEIPGNFIAMFTIGFGPITEGEGAPVGAPLLRYIADAGDNGEIDNDVEADLRDNGQLNYNHDPSVPKDDVYKGLFGDPDACQNELNLRAWCGQYYYSCEDDDTSLACQELRDQGKDLDAVFEAIASRLFTRLSR